MQIPGWGEFVTLIEGILVFLATLTGSNGLAIIILTIAIKLALVPLTLASLRSAKRMQELQPLIKELQRRYGDDRQTLSAETMKLYQEHRVNPFGSCLPIVVQMPIFFGLYYAILNISSNPQYADAGFSTHFLWIPNLAQHDPLYLLPVIVTVTQFIQQRMAMPQRVPGQQLDPQQQMMNQTMQFMPLMIGFFAWNFAAGPVIYWVTQNIFSAVQQYFITGFGTLRDLPGMGFLPVPPWAQPPDGGQGGQDGPPKLPTGRGRPSGAPAPPSRPPGLMGRLYGQISKRVEEIDRQRTAPPAASDGQGPSSAGGPSSVPGPAAEGPARRSSRRARSKR